jgi:hypothetical protein
MLINWFYIVIILGVLLLFINGNSQDRAFMGIIVLFVIFYFSLDLIYPHIKDSIWFYKAMTFYKTYFVYGKYK